MISGAEIDSNTHKNRNVIHFAAQSTPSILINVLIGIHRYENSTEIINQGDENGDTPLHFAAAMSGKGHSWDLLIENGADPNIQNNKGLTPLEIVSND